MLLAHVVVASISYASARVCLQSERAPIGVIMDNILLVQHQGSRCAISLRKLYLREKNRRTSSNLSCHCSWFSFSYLRLSFGTRFWTTSVSAISPLPAFCYLFLSAICVRLWSALVTSLLGSRLNPTFVSTLFSLVFELVSLYFRLWFRIYAICVCFTYVYTSDSTRATSTFILFNYKVNYQKNFQSNNINCSKLSNNATF